MLSVVIISKKGVRVVQRFKNPITAEQFYTKAKNNLSPLEHKIFLVNNSTPIDIPQDYSPQSRGTYYCPYCGEERRYKTDELGNKVCPVCLISSNDFYVKTFNNLWEHASIKKKEKRR